MTIKQQQLLVILLSLVLGIYMGAKIGLGDWFLAILLCMVGFFILALIITRVNSIGFILSFLIFGYIVGNRGFAQITPLWN